jgi:hypothetical protein
MFNFRCNLFFSNVYFFLNKKKNKRLNYYYTSFIIFIDTTFVSFVLFINNYMPLIGISNKKIQAKKHLVLICNLMKNFTHFLLKKNHTPLVSYFLIILTMVMKPSRFKKSTLFDYL